MALQELNLGNQPNDGLGDSGRAGGAKINTNFKEIYEHTFIKDNRCFVTRHVSDVGNTDLTSFRVDDKVAGWQDNTDAASKIRWVEGLVLDASFVFPDDIDDNNKFFLTVDKIKAA